MKKKTSKCWKERNEYVLTWQKEKENEKEKRIKFQNIQIQESHQKKCCKIERKEKRRLEKRIHQNKFSLLSLGCLNLKKKTNTFCSSVMLQPK